MKTRFLFLLVLASAAVCSASEAEWTPSVGPVMAVTSDSRRDVGYGAGVDVAYQPKDWFGLDVAFSWVRYHDVFHASDATGRNSGEGYTVAQMRLVPTVRLYAPEESWWAHVFGEKLVPSAGLGVGYGFYHLGDRYTADRGGLSGKLNNDSIWTPVVMASFALEYRPFESLGFGLRVAELLSLSSDARATHSTEGGLYATYAFYP